MFTLTFFQNKSIFSDSTRSYLIDCGTQTDITCQCYSNSKINISSRHSVATNTYLMDEEEEDGPKEKVKILEDDKKLYLMFNKNEEEESRKPVHFIKSNGDRCTYFYRKEDSKSDLSSANDNVASPMVLSTSSLDVS